MTLDKKKVSSHAQNACDEASGKYKNISKYTIS